MAKIGRNDPCPCGSGKKYKRCCLGKDQQAAPSTPDTMGSVKEQLEAALAAEEVESLEDAQRIADNAMTSHNNAGVPEFHGLSPDEMYYLLNKPFGSPDHVEVPAVLGTEPVAPIVTLFKSLIDGIGDGVKATAKGNLPLRLVNAAAQALTEDIPGELPPRGNVGSEDCFPLLHDTRVVAEVAGLIDATGKKFTLTKKCRGLLAEGGMRSVYPVLLKTYANDFNWAYRDGFDDMPGIQYTFMYTLYLLTLYGHEYRELEFYTDAVISAFPMVVREVEDNEYASADVVAKDVYSLRTLYHFAEFFGLVEIDRRGLGLRPDIKATSLLADAVRFNKHVGSLQTPAAASGQTGPREEWHGKRVNIGYISEERMFAFKEIWMSMPDEEIVHLDDIVGDSQSVGQPLIDAIAQHRPASLCVNDSQWARQLRSALPDIQVRVGPTPHLDDFAEGLQAHLAKSASGSRAVPYLMADIDAASMGRLFGSLAALYKAEPWEYIEDWQYIKVDIPALEVEGACISVIGAVSRDFGFLLFSSIVGYMHMVNTSDDVQRGAPLDLGEDFLSVNYQRGAELPRDNREEIRRNNWQVASPHAYPVIIHHGPDGGPLSLTLDDVRVLEACAVALAAFVDKWGKRFKQQDHPRITEAFAGPDGMEVWMNTPAGSDTAE